MNKHSAPVPVEGLLLRLYSEKSISGDELNGLYAQLRTTRNETTPAPMAYGLTDVQENPLTCPPFDIGPKILTPAPSTAVHNYAPMEIPIFDTRNVYQGFSSDTDKKAQTKTKKSKGKKLRADRKGKGLSFDGLRMNGVSGADWHANIVEHNESHSMDASVESGPDGNIGDKSTGEPLGAILTTWYGNGTVCTRPYKGPLPAW